MFLASKSVGAIRTTRLLPVVALLWKLDLGALVISQAQPGSVQESAALNHLQPRGEALQLMAAIPKLQGGCGPLQARHTGVSMPTSDPNPHPVEVFESEVLR